MAERRGEVAGGAGGHCCPGGVEMGVAVSPPIVGGVACVVSVPDHQAVSR